MSLTFCHGKRHIYGPGGGYCACRKTYWGPRPNPIRQATIQEIRKAVE